MAFCGRAGIPNCVGLYHQASQGKPWTSAGRQVQDDFRGIVRRIIETAHVAELEYRSKQEGVLP